MSWINRLFGGSKGEGGAKTDGGMDAGPAIHGMKKAKDPVCGMEVDRDKAAATSVYQGQTYYFCAVGCKKAFDANPAKYVESGGHSVTGHGGHGL